MEGVGIKSFVHCGCLLLSRSDSPLKSDFQVGGWAVLVEAQTLLSISCSHLLL